MKNIRAILIVVALLAISSYAYSDIIPIDQLPNGYVAENSHAKWRCLKKGMTQEEVRQILGEPGLITQDYYDSPIWYYPDTFGGHVRFGNIGLLWNQKKRVVTEWQEPYN